MSNAEHEKFTMKYTVILEKKHTHTMVLKIVTSVYVNGMNLETAPAQHKDVKKLKSKPIKFIIPVLHFCHCGSPYDKSFICVYPSISVLLVMSLTCSNMTIQGYPACCMRPSNCLLCSSWEYLSIPKIRANAFLLFEKGGESCRKKNLLQKFLLNIQHKCSTDFTWHLINNFENMEQ
jgi:hypothetical protein